ncbi:COQ9 family protein, partial [Acinetobacter baumannii]
RERIRTLVQFRLDQVAGREEALRRAQIALAKPQNVAAALRMGWSSADLMWRLAGDTATDFNHYTKRATLAALYAATLAVYAEDR